MADPTKATYFLLDGLGPLGPVAAWNARRLVRLEARANSLRLAHLPSPPVPLKDADGTFGGMENPTGIAVAPSGDIYASDSATHRIFRIRRHDQQVVYCRIFRVSVDRFDQDRFVWVPSSNRLERWPQTIQGDPTDPAQVEIISDQAWNRERARKLLHCYLRVTKKCSIVSEQEAQYPAALPVGCVCQTSVEYVPCLGGEGRTPRKFRIPRGLAVSRTGTLYVADSGNNRIQIFDVGSLALKRIWDGNRFKNPTDVAVDLSGNVWIADTGNAKVWRFDCRRRRFKAIDGTAVAGHFFEVNYGPDAGRLFVFVPLFARLEQWTTPVPAGPSDIIVVAQGVTSVDSAREQLLGLLHARGARRLFLERDGVYPAALSAGEPMLEPSDLAVDKDGRVYLVDRQKDYVRILDRAGRLVGRVTYRNEVSATFAPTAIAIDADGKLLLASAEGIHRFLVAGQPAYDRCHSDWTTRCGGMSADDKGRIFAAGDSGVAEIVPSEGFQKSGEYVSDAFDSGIDRCSWDKIALSFTALPSSTSVTVSTYTSNALLAAPDVAALDEDQWSTNQVNADDFLILSEPGRYLWLRLRFAGDGISTTDISLLQTYYPRLSYLLYLPAVYQSDPISCDFLDRFLRLFQTELESIEFKIDHLADLFDADGSPAAFLNWLAGWIAMTFDPAWTEAVRRRILRHAPELYRRRGTQAGLQLFLKLAFDIDARVLEHFRLRKWIFLGQGAALGARSQLWGDRVTARMQLDVNSRVGQSALIGTGDPLLDPFSVYAHKFSVFVPAAKIRAASKQTAVQALIEREKPAYTQFSLVPLEPRFRLGVQSTLGLDAVVGTYPRLILNSANLGFDTLLAHEPACKSPLPMVVGQRSRVGVNAVVG